MILESSPSEAAQEKEVGGERLRVSYMQNGF